MTFVSVRGASASSPKGTVDVVVTGGNINGTFKNTATLTDGTNTVQKKEFTLAGAADKTPVTAIEGYPTYGLTDVVTDVDKLVIYVPELKDSAFVTAGGKLYEKTDDIYRIDGEKILSFDANGGTGTTSPMTFVGSETKTLPDSTFERTYYNFTGWNTLADGSGTAYAVGDEFGITEDTTLYAQWDQITYTVTYNANGGTGEMEIGIAYASGSNNFTLPECAFTAPDGKVFKGWKIGTYSTVRAPGYSTKITADTTVTAQWADPVLEVTVDGQTTLHASWDDIIPIVEDKTAYVKILSNHSISKHYYVYAQKLTVDLNGCTISRGNYHLHLYYDVEITGTGTIKGSYPLLVNENVTMKIGSGVTIQTTNATRNGISVYDGATLILNGGTIALPEGSSGCHVSSKDLGVVVVNADDVASTFNAPNVYYNITPTTAPTNSHTSGKIRYRIDNLIANADVTADEGDITTYDGNTYAPADKTVTVAPKSGYELSNVKYNNTDATAVNISYTFTMPAEVVTVTGNAELHVHSNNTYGYCTLCQIKIEGVSITIGASLEVNYYIDLIDETLIDDGGSLVMRFTKNDVTSDYVAGELQTNGLYKFTYGNVAPQCMADSIDSVVYIKNGDTATAIDGNTGYTIRDNAKALLALYPQETELVRLVTDMLYYGKSAQEYRNYNTEDLATNGVEGLIEESTSLPETTVKNVTETTGAAKFTAAGVWFDAVNKIYVKLNTVDGVTLKVNGEQVTLTDTTYYTEGILATEFDKEYTFELYEGETLVQTLTYSVNSYVYAMKDNVKIGAHVKALYNYGLAADVYAE